MHQKPMPENEEAPKPPMTKGERAFNIATYGLVGGVANYIISILAAFSARYGKGAVIAKPIVQALAKHGISEAVAKDTVMTSALFMGGMSTLPVVKEAEDHKLELVKWARRKFGEDEKQPLNYEHKQTWVSLLKSRVIAWVAVFSGFRGAAKFVGPEKIERFEKQFAENIVCKPLGLGTHINGLETKAFRYGRIGALDVIATTAAASMLYVFTRLFGEEAPPSAVLTNTANDSVSVKEADPAQHATASFVERLNASSPNMSAVQAI